MLIIILSVFGTLFAINTLLGIVALISATVISIRFGTRRDLVWYVAGLIMLLTSPIIGFIWFLISLEND